MNIFSLFRRASLMNAEPMAGGNGTAPAPGAAPATTSAPAGDGALSEINDNRTVGELEAAAPAEPATEGDKPAEPAPEAKTEDKKVEVPGDYTDFKVPEGLSLDEGLLTEFSTVAKELGLNQDQAQKLVDLQAKAALAETSAQAKAQAEQSQRWADEIKNDPELGGAKFDKTVATAVKAMEAFGNPELRQLLNESGLGNHPQMVKLFHAIGTSISEDRMVIPGSDSSTTEKTAAEVMFGDVKFN